MKEINNNETKKDFNPSCPTIPSSPELKNYVRTKETIQVGDIFLRNYDLLCISEINDTRVKYDIKTNESTMYDPVFRQYGSEDIETFLNRVTYVPNLCELYDNAQKFLKNEIDFSELEDNMDDSTSLVHKNNRSSLEIMYSEIEIKKVRVHAIRTMVSYQIEEKKKELQKMRDRLDETLSVYSKQMTRIMKVIGMIELYLGIEEELFCLQTGEPANINEPIYLHQQVLYADEEIAITTNNGIDYTQLHKFDVWLLENYKQITPEERCIVVLKPRRYDKDYKTNDKRYENDMNRWNHQSYFLIRNGQNFYRICTEHVQISERLFPRKNELNELNKSFNNGIMREAQMEKFKDQYQKIVLFLQGMIDRSDILKPHLENLNFFTPDENIKLIYDDELALPTGKLLWKDYVAKTNENVNRGSRIIYYTNNLTKDDKRSRFNRYYEYDLSMPNFPSNGLYTVYEIGDTRWDSTLNKYIPIKRLCIKYLPDNTRWDWYGEQERKNRVTWFIDTRYDLFLDYDNICLEDIDFYLTSRIDRKNYLHMLPILFDLKKHLIEEQKQEDGFIKMMLSVCRAHNNNISESVYETIIHECISWWKYKNIWKRPINSNDTKAMSMIEKHIKSRL